MSTEIVIPDITPDIPAFTDEEVDQAASSLGLAVIQSKHLKSLRTLGQSTRSSGVVSIGRGMVMFSASHLMELLDGAKKDADTYADPELKAKFRQIQKDAATALTASAKVLLESDDGTGHIPPVGAKRLPSYDEDVKPNLTQVNANNVHIHTNG